MNPLMINQFVKKNRKVFFWIGAWIVCALVLLSTRTPTAQKPQTTAEITEHWCSLIVENQRFLKASGSTIKNVLERNKEQIAAYRVQLASMHQQVAAHTFTLNNNDDHNDAFEVMLRCRQINALHDQFDVVNKRIDLWKNSLTRTNEQALIIQALSAERMNQTSPEIRDAIDQNILARRGNISNATHFAQSINELSAQIAQTKQALDELHTHANLKRASVIENMFTARPTSLGFILGRFYDYLPLWKIKLEGYFKSQIPFEMRFVFQFLLIAILTTALIQSISKKWIIPLLQKHAILPKKNENIRLFTIGVSLIIIGITCEIANAFIPATVAREAIFRQPANAFFSTAVLLMALTLRNAESRTIPQVIAVALPIVTQHFLFMCLYVALAPRIPILLLIPLINVVCIIWLASRLRSVRGTPLLFTTALLSIIASLASTWLVALGYVYLAFTFIHGWQVILSQVIFTIVITFNVMKLAHQPGQRKRSILLVRLVIPVLWYLLFYSLFSWIMRTYHLSDYFMILFSTPIITHTLVTITFNKIVMILLIATFLQFGLTFFSESIRSSSEKRGTDPALIASALTLSTYISWAIFAVIALVICDVNTKSLQVMLGGFGLGLGFALKGILENFFCGVSLLIGQDIRPGDTIEIERGTLATVKKITFSKTIVETVDGAIITYPNMQVKAKEFRNWTRNHRFRRFDIYIDVAYGTDLTRARELLLEAVRRQPNVELRYPAEPIVFISGFQDSAIRFIIRFWVSSPLYLEVSTQLQIKVNTLFEKNNISIPFPQLDVHLSPQEKPTSM